MIQSEKFLLTGIRKSKKLTIYVVSITIAVTLIFSTLMGIFTTTPTLENNLVYAQDTTTDTINASKTVNASKEEVWKIISDLDNNPKYWPITVVDIVSRSNSSLERGVTVPAPPFMDNKAFQTIEIIPEQYKVIENQTEGAVTGVKTISLNQEGTDSNKTRINILWNLDLSNIPNIGQGFAKNGISNSVNEALDKIENALPK
jgi:carbon monoxide dehydrogenase subunit G